MRKISSFVLFMMLLSWLSTGCGASPINGTEAGNPSPEGETSVPQGVESGNPKVEPKVEGKTLSLFPVDSQVIYVLKFLAPPNVRVSKFYANFSATTETSYLWEELHMIVSATLSEQKMLEVEIQWNEAGDVTDLQLWVNGETVEVEYQLSEPETALCSGPENNFALRVTDILCDRLNSNHPSLSCGACEIGLLQTHLFPNFFGWVGTLTLQELVDLVDAGTWEVEAEALNDCFNEIGQIPPIYIQEVYDPGEPADFSQVRDMIPAPACTWDILGTLSF